MKKIFLLALFLRVADFSYSQLSEFNKTLNINNSYFSINSIIPNDTGYLLAGMQNGKIAVCQLNDSANLSWIMYYYNTSYTHSFNYAPNNLKRTLDSNFYIGVGTIQNGSATINKAFILKIDSTYNQIYMNNLIEEDSCNGCTFLNNVFENSIGQYVSIGENARDSAGNFLLNKIGDGILVITDTSGNILNYKNYGGPLNYHDQLNYGLQMGSYYYLFGSTRSFAPSSVTNSYDRTDGWVVKTDMHGNEVQSALYGNPLLYDYTFTCAIVNVNEIITALSSGTIKHPTGAILLSPSILYLNENLGVNNEIRIRESYIEQDTIYRSYIEHMVMNDQNELLLLMRGGKFNINTYTIENSACVVKLSNNRKVRYYRKYMHNGNQFNNELPSVMSLTPDNGYIFGGGVVDMTLSPVQQAWLVKTDSLGCDGFTSCNDTAMVVQILNYPDTLCKDSTCQIAVRLKGRSAPYRLYANSTLALDSIYYPYSLPLWIDTIMPVVLSDTGWQNLIVTLHEPWERVASDTVQMYVRNCPTTANLTEYYKQKVVIYPNPATTELHIKIRGLIEGTYTISMYDTQGKTVDIITTKEQEKVIDISKYKQGVYWVRVLGNNVVRSEKVIIPKND